MNLAIYQKRDLSELNQLRTAILTSNRFRKWRNHIRTELKEISKISTTNNISK